jgi:hypothetical protein
VTQMHEYERLVRAFLCVMRPSLDTSELLSWRRTARCLLGVAFLCNADPHETALWIHALVTGKVDRIVFNVRE